MECIVDDLLGLVFNDIEDPNHRKSLSLVSKQWLRVEGFYRSSLQVFEPNSLPMFLPRFPNLLKIQIATIIFNHHIQFLVHTCPKIQVLNLHFKENRDFWSEDVEFNDFDDEGLSAIAKGLSDLNTFILRKRIRVGDFGVNSLLGFSRNLVNLDLSMCVNVSDSAFECIGALSSLEVLNLQGCCLITDVGLGFVALCRALKRLNFAECDRITDLGLIYIKDMPCLEELNLADCGPKITDIGGEMALADMKSLKTLNLSWLINVTDASIIVIAKNCRNLEVLELSGCELVSGFGVRALSGHGSLKGLVFTRCDEFISGSDLEQLVLRCPSLEYMVLDKLLRNWIPETVQENVMRHCSLTWK